MKNYFFSAATAALLTAGLSVSAPVEAARGCSSANQGATYTTTINTGSSILTSTYMCLAPAGWQLVSVWDCNINTGKCGWR